MNGVFFSVFCEAKLLIWADWVCLFGRKTRFEWAMPVARTHFAGQRFTVAIVALLFIPTY
jgi:hypothetical protein